MIAPLDAGDILQDVLVAHQKEQLLQFAHSQTASPNLNFLQHWQTQNLQSAKKGAHFKILVHNQP